MEKHFCPYCMSPVRKGESCKVCGLTAGTYVPSPHHLPPGTTVNGRYLVGRVLGEGGFGITYLGCDTRLELKVAIKEYFPVDRCTRNAAAALNVTGFMGSSGQSFERGKQKFLNEARTMARMDKQQVIVGVRDFFEANNTAYIVMEYIEGTNFSKLVEQRGGKLASEELLPILEPLFRALSTMHELGLIHRDISPDNLMLENGKVRLLDFGCARETTGSSETMTIALKQGYAPLEQYRQSGQGPWTDIYALCATIYYCLTGKTPQQAMDRIVEDTLLPPTKLGAKLTIGQEKALMKGLELSAKKRFQTVEELRAALYGGAPEERPAPKAEPPHPKKPPEEPVIFPKTEVPSRPAPAPKPVERPSRKSPKWIWASLAALAVLGLSLIGFLPKNKNQVAEVETRATEVQRDRYEGGVVLSKNVEESTLRMMLENDTVPAVILSGNLELTISEEPLEIVKPLRIEEGVCLTMSQPVTVRGDGLLRIEGQVTVEGILHTTEGGTISVGSAGELTGETLIWMDGERDLLMEDGARVAGIEDEDRFVVADEDAIFGQATHVSSLEALQAAAGDGRAIVIEGDITLSETVTVKTPVRVERNVTVSGNGALMPEQCLINYGSILCPLLPGGDRTILLNYGSIDASGGEHNLRLDVPGFLINLGEIRVGQGDFLQTNLYNMGKLIHSAHENLQGLNLFCDLVYNSGEIQETGAHSGEITMGNGCRIRNLGTIQVENGGMLRNQGMLDNCGELRMETGSQMNNCGWLLADHRGGVLALNSQKTEDINYGTITWYDGQPRNGELCLNLPLTSREAATEAELREAMADESCEKVILTGDIAIAEDMTITKRVDATDGILSVGSEEKAVTLTLREGGMLYSSDYGAVLDFHGTGSLVLERGKAEGDSPVVLCDRLLGCKALILQDESQMVVGQTLEMSTEPVKNTDGQQNTKVSIKDSATLTVLRGMKMVEGDVNVGGYRGTIFYEGLSARLKTFGDLELRYTNVNIGRCGRILVSDANGLFFRSHLGIQPEGRFRAEAYGDGFTLNLNTFNSYGTMEFHMPVGIGKNGGEDFFDNSLNGSLNGGTIEATCPVTLSDELANRREFLLIGEGKVILEGENASIYGTQPKTVNEDYIWHRDAPWF